MDHSKNTQENTTTLTTIRGMRDILPDETPLWARLEQVARDIFGRYGYRELRTPILEKSGLFARAVGETTDIVEKEMYTFADRNGDSLTLRPEGTASVVRSFIEHGMDRQLPWRVFYMGPMFRYERPQKGRYRQFHQIGCELFGPATAVADAEVMSMVMSYLRAVGVSSQLTLEINSLGCPSCRPAFRQSLTDYFSALKSNLCEDCQRRLERNPLRILDCKQEQCRELSRNSPHTGQHLCGGCEEHFTSVRGFLDGLSQPYQVNNHLMRGLDYYTRTAFEVTTLQLGAQNTVAAGGRYDQLVADMGGPATPAVGFAMGVERLALLLAGQDTVKPPLVYVATLGPAAVLLGLQLAEALRGCGVGVELALAGGSLKSQMKKADRCGAAHTVILGDEEATHRTLLIREMATGEQRRLDYQEGLHFLAAGFGMGGMVP
ncbi:MAG: histidine--tRNA ligase [Magnetococcales bacterium]|nr:histidine--tRNA ligase [Magnetococcales bacterium]NGZ27008.1 histidine--tRNA ligase [Magnetococcales bacterium]